MSGSSLDKQLEITEQTVQNWIATVQTMRDLKEALLLRVQRWCKVKQTDTRWKLRCRI
jgi:hypothetical protein